MKPLTLLLLALALSACATGPVQNVGLIHAYVFRQAEGACQAHGGLHYAVAARTVYGTQSGNSQFNDYPCSSTYKFRCQDGALVNFDDGVKYCFIDQSQLTETLEGK